MVALVLTIWAWSCWARDFVLMEDGFFRRVLGRD